MADEIKKTGAQKKQMKFSGLIKAGVISELKNNEDKDFPSEPIQGNHELPTESSLQSAPIKAVHELPQTPNTPSVEPGNAFTKISLGLVDDSPYQPRKLYDLGDIDDLGHSMVAAGLKEAIKVRRIGDRFELISGHRRTRAARSLGWTEIDAHIVECSDRDAKLVTMISNEARVDLTDYEKGKLYQEALQEGFGKNQTEVANLFGTSQPRVSARMNMLNLPPIFIKLLESNAAMFGADCARDIAQLLKEYPAEEKLIHEAVLRITESGADQSSVKQWFLQMVKQKSKREVQKPKVITNRTGRQVFTAKLDGRVITVRISDIHVDADTTLLKVMESLKAVADIDAKDD